MHEKCLNDQSLFERILIYVYLKLFSRDGATRNMIQNHVITPRHVRTIFRMYRGFCPLGCQHGDILFNPHSGMKKGGKRLCG